MTQEYGRFSTTDIYGNVTSEHRFASGEIYFYKNGQKHRDDGPAVISADGGKEWYQNGYRHREDGPSFEKGENHKEWWWE